MKTILICDDHSIIRRGLKFILSKQFENFIVDEVYSIAETYSYLKDKKPDFAIFDLQLSDGNMIEALPNILTRYPELDVLIFSMSNEDIYAKRLLQIGAKGYLNKKADEAEVIRALVIFLSGESYISHRLNNTLISELRNNKSNENPFVNLSNREVEVTKHLLIGEGVKEISKQMNLHSNTIVTYKNRLFEKLAVANLVDLTDLAKVYHFI